MEQFPPPQTLGKRIKEKIRTFIEKLRHRKEEKPKKKPKWGSGKTVDSTAKEDLETIAKGLMYGEDDDNERLPGGGKKAKRHPGAE